MKKLLKFFLNNVRTPIEREGDFSAQIMANKIGINRILELIEKYGIQTVKFYSSAMLDYSEKVLRDLILNIKDGEYGFSDYLDGDGLGTDNIKIKVTIKIAGDRVEIDFCESDPQVTGSVNAVYSITLSAVLYVFRSLIDLDIPTNAGLLRPIKVRTKKKVPLLMQIFSTCAGGNVETSQRIVDVILGALSYAIPDKIPAASQGSMNNVSIGGIDDRTNSPFAYYETIGGGMGAFWGGNGESAVHSHMTNTLNTPIEALEFSYPFMVTEYSIRNKSGGDGEFKGGDGIIREIKLLSDAEVTVLSERREHGPYGLMGGDHGKPGKKYLGS